MRRALLFVTLLLAAGCGGDDDPGLDPITCPDPPAAVDPCAGATCFTACGTRVAIGPAPVASGFTVLAAPTVRPFAANRVGQGLVALVPTGVESRDGESGALRGTVTVGGSPYAIAEAGGLAFVDTAAGVVYPVAVSDPEHPEVLASWRPEDPIQLVPADNRRVIFRTPGGISLIDVTDPAAPVEAACLAVPAVGGMEAIWHVTASAGFVAAAGGDPPRVYLYDLLRPDEIAGALQIDPETSVILHKEVLVITSGGRLIAYNAVPDDSLSERGRADLPGAVFAPPIVGGFALFGAVALDLDHDLAPYDVVDTGGAACTISLNAQDHSASYFLAPGLVPDRRFSLESLPEFECGPREPRFAGAFALAHEPNGPRLLVLSDEGTSIYEPATNARVDDVAVAGPHAAWVGGTLVGVTPQGSDLGMALTTELSWATADAPTTRAGDLSQPTAYLDHAADADTLYLLVEGEPRDYGTDPPAARTHQILRFDAAAAALTPLPLPDKAAPVAIAAGSGRLWYLDAARQAVALDAAAPTFDELVRADLERGSGDAPAFASSLGLFFSDGCGALTWVNATGEVALFANETAGTLIGVDDTRLYSLTNDAPANAGLPGVRRLVAWAPTTLGEGIFALTEEASLPVPDGSASWTTGDPLALTLGGLHVLE